jgi:hypothetical protein
MVKVNTEKRPLSNWNLFVKKVKNDNPNKTFKEVLVMASELKRKGQMPNKMMPNKMTNKMPVKMGRKGKTRGKTRGKK